MITVNNRKIEYLQTGEGPAVLFVPGSYSTPMAWNNMQRRLPQSYRFVGTSLCGYGGTDETRSIEDFGMEHLVQVLETVAEKIGEPVHLVGHSLGGTVALATALSGTVEILSITTFEANPLAVLHERGHIQLLNAAQVMSADFEAAHFAGERDAAGRIIDFWGGEHAFTAMPDAVQEYCRSTTYANVLDWRTAFDFQATLADYAQLTIPVLLVRGSLAIPAMVEITEALKACIPNNRSAVVEGASHFLNTSHAYDCSRLLADFLEEFAE